MNVLDIFRSTKIGSSVIVNGDSTIIAKYLPNKYGVGLMDPQFRTVMAADGMSEEDYYSYIRYVAKIIVSKVKDTGIIVSMNLSDGIGAARETFEYLNWYRSDEIRVPVLERGTKNTITLYIDLYKKGNGKTNIHEWNEIKHKAGENDIREAPRCWLMERVFALIGKENITSVLDLFGGSGNIPHICSTFGIDCVSIEISLLRYTNIVKRLSQERSTCLIATCVSKTNGKFCPNHWNAIQRVKNKDIELFLGLDQHFNSVTNKNYKEFSITRNKTSSVDFENLLENSVILAEKAKNANNNRTTDTMEGSIQGRTGNNTKNSEEIS